MIEVTKKTLASKSDVEKLVSWSGADPPTSLPCVAVCVEIDPDPRPCYYIVEYVYPMEVVWGGQPLRFNVAPPEFRDGTSRCRLAITTMEDRFVKRGCY